MQTPSTKHANGLHDGPRAAAVLALLAWGWFSGGAAHEWVAGCLFVGVGLALLVFRPTCSGRLLAWVSAFAIMVLLQLLPWPAGWGRSADLHPGYDGSGPWTLVPGETAAAALRLLAVLGAFLLAHGCSRRLLTRGLMLLGFLLAAWFELKNMGVIDHIPLARLHRVHFDFGNFGSNAHLAFALLPAALLAAAQVLGRWVLHPGTSWTKALGETWPHLLILCSTTRVLWLGFSRAGLLALFAGLLALALLLQLRARAGLGRWIRALVVLVLALAAVALVTPGATIKRWRETARAGIRQEGRWGIWRDAWTMAGRTPALGFGAGGFHAAFPRWQTALERFHVRYPENWPLQNWIEWGPVGSVLWLAALLSFLGLAARPGPGGRRARAGALAGILAAAAHGLVGFSFELPGLAFPLGVLAAMALADAPVAPGRRRASLALGALLLAGGGLLLGHGHFLRRGRILLQEARRQPAPRDELAALEAAAQASTLATALWPSATADMDLARTHFDRADALRRHGVLGDGRSPAGPEDLWAARQLELDLALAAAHRAAERDRGGAAPWLLCFDILAAAGRTEQAALALEQAARRAPHDAEVQARRAVSPRSTKR